MLSHWLPLRISEGAPPWAASCCVSKTGAGSGMWRAPQNGNSARKTGSGKERYEIDLPKADPFLYWVCLYTFYLHITKDEYRSHAGSAVGFVSNQVLYTLKRILDTISPWRGECYCGILWSFFLCHFIHKVFFFMASLQISSHSLGVRFWVSYNQKKVLFNPKITLINPENCALLCVLKVHSLFLLVQTWLWHGLQFAQHIRATNRPHMPPEHLDHCWPTFLWQDTAYYNKHVSWQKSFFKKRHSHIMPIPYLNKW